MGNEEMLHDLKHSLQTLVKIFIPVGAAFATSNPLLAAGTSAFFLESFFGIRNRLKMEKVESFLTDLNQDLEKVKVSLDRTEKSLADSQYLLERVLICVSNTHGELKLLAFKKIMVGQLLDNITFDKAENYTELINSLGIQEVVLLKHYYENELRLNKLSKQKLERKNIKAQKDTHLDIEIEKARNLRDACRLKFKKKYSEGELQFIVSSLVSRGLVLKGPGGNGAWYGDNIFNDMKITDFGCEITEFIQDTDLPSQPASDFL